MEGILVAANKDRAGRINSKIQKTNENKNWHIDNGCSGNTPFVNVTLRGTGITEKADTGKYSKSHSDFSYSNLL